MSSRPPDVARFRSALRGIHPFADDTVDEVLRLAEQTGDSPVEVLVQRGLIAPEDVEVIELLLHGDEAIPGYELISLIGRGGMGVVYRARQKNLNRYVALKTILAGWASNRVAMARFEREAVTIAQLAHPNIVGALDFGRHQGRFFLAMEIIEGEDLSSYIHRQGRLAESTAWGIARQVAGGLLHASRAGVIHRDIKPANILLVAPPEGYQLRPGLPMAKISDFGLAMLSSQQIVQERLTMQNTAVGSPHYMAPEQLDGDDCDTRADIYALGATVFHMLAGKPPWSGRSWQRILHAKINHQQPAFGDELPHVHSETTVLIAAMMEPDPLRRIKDYTNLMSAMDRLEQILPVASAEQPWRRVSGQHQAVNVAANAISPTEPFPANRQSDQESWAPVVKEGVPVTKGPSPPAARRMNVKLAAGAVAVVVMALAAIPWAWFTFRNPPVSLVLTSEQQYLFNGRDLLRASIVRQSGGWSVRDGRILHEAGTFGYLTFEVPDWEYFSFEVTVELVPDSRVFVQFAPEQLDGSGKRSTLRIVDHAASLGSLADVRGQFNSSSPSFALDSDRSAHSVKLQREVSRWTVYVDGTYIGAVRDNRPRLNQITLAAEKVTSSAGQTEPSAEPRATVAFAEIVATRWERGSGNR
jgi:eukaryotic-like serine/threonine-protein kinase